MTSVSARSWRRGAAGAVRALAVRGPPARPRGRPRAARPRAGARPARAARPRAGARRRAGERGASASILVSVTLNHTHTQKPYKTPLYLDATPFLVIEIRERLG